MTPKGQPHPSGKPIRERIVRERPIWRTPSMEAETPRLRPIKGNLDCVGFVQFPVESYDDAE